MFEILNENNIEGYIYGGYLRDKILGYPFNDVDIIINKKFKHTYKINDVKFGFAYRYNYKNDFTINNILYDYNKKLFIDYCGGMIDIKRGILKFNKKFDKKYDMNKDIESLIRGLRFYSIYNFEFEEETFIKIKNNINLIEKISPSHIMYNLNLIKKFNKMYRFYKIISDLGIKNNIFG